ncbi:MAG: flavodoxin [Clostridiales bacterium]|nr:flavodoxin [Clostridiales bacterium]
MKIGLIIHSVTGNTLKVAKELQTVLVSKGHNVEIKEIKTQGKVNPGETEANFTELPSIDGYDALIFGSHTEAFQLEQTMKLYFKQLESLKGCKVACISTHQFPFNWMGGNSAVNKMKIMCKEKGAIVLGTVVVDWSPKSKREEKIHTAVNIISSLF